MGGMDHTNNAVSMRSFSTETTLQQIRRNRNLLQCIPPTPKPKFGRPLVQPPYFSANSVWWIYIKFQQNVTRQNCTLQNCSLYDIYNARLSTDWVAVNFRCISFWAFLTPNNIHGAAVFTEPPDYYDSTDYSLNIRLWSWYSCVIISCVITSLRSDDYRHTCWDARACVSDR